MHTHEVRGDLEAGAIEEGSCQDASELHADDASESLDDPIDAPGRDRSNTRSFGDGVAARANDARFLRVIAPVRDEDSG